MPLAIDTIEDHITKIGKKGFWLCFNPIYNANVIRKPTPKGELDESKTSQKDREEFLEFMRANFPNTKLTDVFDSMPPEHLIYPFLGSIAVDCDDGDEVYRAIDSRYMDEFMPKSLNVVFYSMELETAQRLSKERAAIFEGAFG